MRGAILAVAACALLAACATSSGAPRVIVQRVMVPIATPCAADPGAKPPLTDPKAFAAEVAAASDLWGVARIYAAGHQEDADWIARLEAANAGCRTPAK